MWNFTFSKKPTFTLEISRARVCISPSPQSPSPKLETTRSLVFEQNNKLMWLIISFKEFVTRLS